MVRHVTDHKPTFNFHHTLHLLESIVHYLRILYPPLKKKAGGMLFSTCRSVGRSVRPSDVRSIPFDPYA